MGEAERITRQRELEHQAALADLSRHTHAERQTQEQTVLDQIEALIPRALALLEKAGYPGGTMVEIEFKHHGKKRTWWGGWSENRAKAGWKVAETWAGVKTEMVLPPPVWMSNGPTPTPVYLLSDGQFSVPSGPPFAASDLVRKNLADQALGGLQRIIDQHG